LDVRGNRFFTFRAKVQAAGLDGAHLLSRNRELPGNLKFVLRREGLCLVEDVPAAAAMFDPSRVAAALARMNAVLGEAEELEANRSSQAGVDLSGLMASSPRTFHERSGGRYAVDLETRRGRVKTAVVERVGIGMKVSLELGNLEGLTADSGSAIVHLLLRAGAEVRLARPVMDPRQSVAFEVRLEVTSGEEDLEAACLALTAAADVCDAEFGTLKDERIASLYLLATGTYFPRGGEQ